MLSKSVKTKRRHNKTYYELTRQIEVRLIDTTMNGHRHFLITLVSPTIVNSKGESNFAHHFEANGEQQLKTAYREALLAAKNEAAQLRKIGHPGGKTYQDSAPTTGWPRLDEIIGRMPGFKRDEVSVISAKRSTERKTMFGLPRHVEFSAEQPELLAHLKSLNSRKGMLISEEDLEKITQATNAPKPILDRAISALDGGPPLTMEELAELLVHVPPGFKSTISYPMQFGKGRAVKMAEDIYDGAFVPVFKDLKSD